MALKLYFDLISQPARAIYMFLKVANIEFQPCPVKLRRDENLHESYNKINPFHKVPALNDNGFNVIESVAMIRYLAKTHNVPAHWYPTDAKEQARVDEFLEWQHTTIRMNSVLFYQHKFLFPMMLQEPVKEDFVTYFGAELEKSLKDIQSIWLNGGEKKFINGDEISVADLLACTELEQPKMAGYDVFAKYPILRSYRDRVRQKTGPVYDEVHEVIWKIAHKYKGVPHTTVQELVRRYA